MSGTHIKLISKKAILFLPLLLIAAILSGVSLYWVSFWFLLLWTTASMGWLLHAARCLDMKLQVSPDVTERKRPVNLNILLSSRSLLPLPFCELYFYSEPGKERKIHLSQNYYIHLGDSLVEKSLEVDDIKISRPWEKNLKIEFPRRGHYLVGPVKIRLYSPLGNLAVEKSFSQEVEITVLPRLLPFISTFSPQRKLPWGANNKSSLPLDFSESYDLRPFTPGDSFKRINWKVSARQGELYTRRVKSSGEPRLLICVELSRDLYFSPQKQELVLEKALSLAGYLLSCGLHVGILTWDGKNHYLPPGPRKKQLLTAQKLFTMLKPEDASCLAETILRSSWRIKEKNLLWIVPRLNESYGSALEKIKAKGYSLTLFTTASSQAPTPGSGFRGTAASPFSWQLEYHPKSKDAGEVKIS